MLKLERTSVMNLENAMRGARNPMNSWGRMTAFMMRMANITGTERSRPCETFRKAGSDHRKFLRQVFVSAM